MHNTFEINQRKIGLNYPVYTIAELSCNHNQDYDIAVKLVHQAASAGADAVKLQLYRPDTITIDCDNDYFKIKGTIWEGEKLYDLYQSAYTPWEWFPKLMKIANDLGMDLFASPFDETSVDFMEKHNTPAYKVASFEIVDHVLLKKIAKTGKPVIVSTGMSSLAEIEEAVNCLREFGTTQIALLKCTSAYPAKPEDANLMNIKNLSQTFGNIVTGLSDHTLGLEVPITSVALGASIIEKHFTLSRESGSADDKFSLLPEEFKQMIESVKITRSAIGKVHYGGVSSENDTRKLRRSLFIINDVKMGDKITTDNVRSIRPGDGLHTRYYDQVLGKKFRNDFSKGTPLSWSLIE